MTTWPYMPVGRHIFIRRPRLVLEHFAAARGDGLDRKTLEEDLGRVDVRAEVERAYHEDPWRRSRMR